MTTWEWISVAFALIGMFSLLFIMFAPRDLDYVDSQEEEWERASCPKR